MSISFNSLRLILTLPVALVCTTQQAAAQARAATTDALRTQYEQQFAAGEFVEAEQTAKRLIEQTLRRADSSAPVEELLQMLAHAQLGAGNAELAIQNFEDAASAIEDRGDRLAIALVEPLHGLARAQVAAGAYIDATSSYERAIHILRVNEGPQNLRQAELLTELVELQIGLGNLREAGGLQKYQLDVYRRAYPETDERVVGAWNRRGQIYGLRGDHLNAQENYNSAADIMRVADGTHSLAQVPLLESLSESYLYHARADLFTRIEMARAELEKIIIIVENNPAATPVTRGTAHLRMGDFMQRFGDWGSALHHYRRAWNHLSVDADGRALRDQIFAAPVMVNDRAIANLMAPDGPSVGVMLTVDATGQVDGIEFADQDCPGDQRKKARLIVRKMRFRPAFRDGDPTTFQSASHTVNVPMIEHILD